MAAIRSADLLRSQHVDEKADRRTLAARSVAVLPASVWAFNTSLRDAPLAYFTDTD